MNPLPTKFLVDSNWITDPHQIANEFNKYFSKLGEDLASNFPDSERYENILLGRVGTTFSFAPTSMEEIRSIVPSLKNKSPGIDEIPMSLFKSSIDTLADIMAHICNKSMNADIFPRKLGISIIICLYKKGPQELISNFRGLSFLVSFSKILEKVVARGVMEYFQQNNNICLLRLSLDFWLKSLHVMPCTQL